MSFVFFGFVDFFFVSPPLKFMILSNVRSWEKKREIGEGKRTFRINSGALLLALSEQ